MIVQTDEGIYVQVLHTHVYRVGGTNVVFLNFADALDFRWELREAYQGDGTPDTHNKISQHRLRRGKAPTQSPDRQFPWRQNEPLQ